MAGRPITFTTLNRKLPSSKRPCELEYNIMPLPACRQKIVKALMGKGIPRELCRKPVSSLAGKKSGAHARESPRRTPQVSQGGFGKIIIHLRTPARCAAGVAFHAGTVTNKGEIAAFTAGIAFVSPHLCFADLAPALFRAGHDFTGNT